MVDKAKIESLKWERKGLNKELKILREESANISVLKRIKRIRLREIRDELKDNG